MECVNICGIKIHNVSFQESLDAFGTLVDEGRAALAAGGQAAAFVVTPNVDHIVKLTSDEDFRKIYARAALVLADGVPLLWAAKFLGTPLKAKVSGSDLFPALCGLAAQKGWKIFFMGGREGAALKAADVLKLRFPGLNVVGTDSPPLGFEKNPVANGRIIDEIRAAAPDILFVGLGAPKQETWIDSHKDELGVPVSVGIGVSFEFVAGMVKRAPAWMQKAGLEWSWRILQEPGRLWKRYLIEDIKFFRMVLKQKMRT